MYKTSFSPNSNDYVSILFFETSKVLHATNIFFLILQVKKIVVWKRKLKSVSRCLMKEK